MVIVTTEHRSELVCDYEIVLFLMTFSDLEELAKYSLTRSIARPLFNS